MKHTCIKPACDNSYEDKEPDPYYCSSCQEANVALAKTIDAQIASRPKRSSVSAIKEYEAGCNMTIGGMKGMQIK